MKAPGRLKAARNPGQINAPSRSGKLPIMGFAPFRPAGVAPAVPNATPIGTALERSVPLALLRERLRDSTARFNAVRPLLPAPLCAHVKPGLLDQESWSLLADSPAVAAKLRHLQPRLEAELLQQGWKVVMVRIRIAHG